MRTNILALVLIFSVLSSCTKSYLDIDDNSQLYRQSYVKDAATLKQYVNGIYLGIAGQLEFGAGSGYAEIVADNLKPANAGVGLYPHYLWAQQVDPKDEQLLPGVDDEARSMNPLWRTGYLLIRSCDFVLEEADKYRNENPALVDDLKGQALALRALIHFRLVNTFAQHYGFTTGGTHVGIPYVTSSNVKVVFGRVSVAEVYDKMIDDLEMAMTLLPSGLADTRGISQAAVKAILGRIYLFQEDFSKSFSYAKDIATKYPLMQISQGYPKSLFEYKGQSATESLFQLSPQGGDIPGATIFLNVYLSTWIKWYATDDIADILREDVNDIRSQWVVGSTGAWTVNKFPSNAAPSVQPAPSPETGAYYQPVIRSSEVFLIAAEAAGRTGDEEQARFYLDAVRKRANPSCLPTTAAGPSLLDSIYKERRKELAFEGLRMYDLQRWKQSVQRKDALPGAPKVLPYPSDKAIAPIPPFDVDLTGMQQNAGY